MDTTEATPIQVARLQTILSMPLWVARLQTILSMPLRTDTPEILTLLERLAAAEVTVETLRETRALAAVSSRFLRCHRDARIRARSQELVVQWRAFATGTDEEEHEHSACESTSTTISTPSSAVVALSGGLATVSAAVAAAGTLADMDADAPALPHAGAPTEAAPDVAGRRSTGPTPDFGTMSAVDFLARCSATLQRQQRKASRRTELRKLGSGGFSPRRDQPAKVKHEQRRKDKKVKPTIDKKQNKVGSALVMRVGAEGRATWGGGGD